jgi:hypothetical protein
VIEFACDLRMEWYSPGIPIPSINKTNPHDITEISEYLRHFTSHFTFDILAK